MLLGGSGCLFVLSRCDKLWAELVCFSFDLLMECGILYLLMNEKQN
ncbi:hypothetical protein SALWKB12_0485 [Snodgrassella communis]|nr:hypothetical protein SALWKB12_0485 [Snodgrassella communis]